MRNDTTYSADRIPGIDSLRFLAMWAVILIHLGPDFITGRNFAGALGGVAWTLDEICSLAVPLFFTISGYFFGKACSRPEEIPRVYGRYIRRLLFVFIGWSLIYALPKFTPQQMQLIHQYGFLRVYMWQVQKQCFNQPVVLLMQGTAGHLWFLSSLMQALGVVALCLWLRKERVLVYTAVLVFLFLPLIKAYIPPPAGGPFDYVWNPLVGPFIALMPVVAGWMLTRCKAEHAWAWGRRLVLAGLALLAGKYVCTVAHVSLSLCNLATVILPAGIVLLALARRDFGARWGFHTVGRWTLGIYCVHVLVRDRLALLAGFFAPPVWSLAYPVLIYLCSAVAVLALRMTPLTRRLVV